MKGPPTQLAAGVNLCADQLRPNPGAVSVQQVPAVSFNRLTRELEDEIVAGGW